MSRDWGAAVYRPHLVAGVQRTARGLSRVLLSIEVVGRQHIPAAGQVIIAGNHSGTLDGPLVSAWATRPLRTLTKIEIFKGLPGRLISAVGQIPLDRDIPDRLALHTALSVLADGGAVGVYPEGTRGDGELIEVRAGIGYLAACSGAPIVPVAVLGSKELMPKGAKLPNRAAHLRIVFGRPFQPEIPDDPRLRRTSGLVAEEIRRHLRAHLVASRGDTPLG